VSRFTVIAVRQFLQVQIWVDLPVQTDVVREPHRNARLGMLYCLYREGESAVSPTRMSGMFVPSDRSRNPGTEKRMEEADAASR
jgi:hypothetical protein